MKYQVIPNINGASSSTKRFLRGSETSGTTGGSETHTHTISLVANETVFPPTGTGATSTLPSYYEVVWIMRIK